MAKLTTNTMEGYFSILKRGIIGTYHQCGNQHLKRYLAEFDFRYYNRSALEITRRGAPRNDSADRGKRLTYRRTGEGAHA